ncbi:MULTISPECIES: hypothetical protein [Sorangium]|nr:MULTISPECIES: hypothetical protein [Sorangium]
MRHAVDVGVVDALAAHLAIEGHGAIPASCGPQSGPSNSVKA